MKPTTPVSKMFHELKNCRIVTPQKRTMIAIIGAEHYRARIAASIKGTGSANARALIDDSDGDESAES